MAISTVGSGKQFSTLQAWVNSKQSASGTQDAECYGSVGSAGVTFGTWNPSSTRIYAATGQRHNLDLTGAIVTGIIDFSAFAGAGVFTIDGLRLDGTGGGAWDILSVGNGAIFTVQNCIVTNMAIDWTPDVTTPGGSVVFNIINNVLLGAAPEMWAGTGLDTAGTFNWNVYHNFIDDGPNFNETGTLPVGNWVVRNNVCGNYFKAVVRGTMTASNNLSANGTADSVLGGSNNLNNKALASQVKNVANNFKLLETAVVIDAGIAISTVPTDALGTKRPGNPSIGPYDFEALARKLMCRMPI